MKHRGVNLLEKNMKLKIVFSEPPHINDYSLDEQIIVIPSPYKLTQAKVAEERVIQKEDGSTVNYEIYCAEMNELIFNTLKAEGLEKREVKETLIIRL